MSLVTRFIEKGRLGQETWEISTVDKKYPKFERLRQDKTVCDLVVKKGEMGDDYCCAFVLARHPLPVR